VPLSVVAVVSLPATRRTIALLSISSRDKRCVSFSWCFRMAVKKSLRSSAMPLSSRLPTCDVVRWKKSIRWVNAEEVVVKNLTRRSYILRGGNLSRVERTIPAFTKPITRLTVWVREPRRQSRGAPKARSEILRELGQLVLGVRAWWLQGEPTCQRWHNCTNELCRYFCLGRHAPQCG